MRVTRVLDVLVLLLLATLLVMPRANVTVKAALPLPPQRRERVAELQAHLLGSRDDVPAALELTDLFLEGHRPDWALATVGAVLPEHPNDYRLHLRRAVAYADRFEAAPAFAAADQALALCNAPPPAGGPTCPHHPAARDPGANQGHRHAAEPGPGQGQDLRGIAPGLGPEEPAALG